MPHDQISFWNATSLACLDNSEEDSSAGHSRSQRQIYALELHFYCKLLACFMSWSQKGLKQDLDTQSKLEGEINNSDLNKSFWQTKSLWKNR